MNVSGLRIFEHLNEIIHFVLSDPEIFAEIEDLVYI